jgi:class 3 adenylate cyclase/tetratricopeptide (TPR) repeat protein
MRFCSACGAPLGEPAARAWRQADSAKAQRRHLTVMFCDVVDSTALAERLDPEDFREVLSSFQGACASAIERFQGYVARWIGDGVLAYFGYPRAHEDDAQRAIYAGLGILAEIAKLNEQLRRQFDVSLNVRAGLDTGLVVAGEMGAGQTPDPLAIVGETPHIAARLQALATPGSVLISDATLQLGGERFETETIGARALKGISRPIGVHRVLRVAPAPPGLEPLGARPHTPLVDRTDELGRLREAWQSAKRGEAAVVHVIGEAGIGKSRLVRALRAEVSNEGATESMLQCSPHHASTALYPAARFLEQRLGAAEGEGSRERLHELAEGLGPARDEAVALLADLLSIPVETEAGAVLTPRDARNSTLQVLESLLVRASAGAPLLFVVEDLHWADPTTLELVQRCVAKLAGMPVACLLTFRSEFQPPWSYEGKLAEIALGPLAAEEVRAMAEAASAHALDADTLTQVESAADGVPLYVEEVVKVLAAADPPPGQRRPAGIVPATLQGLLAERLDRLPELGEVIDIAAVLGREFEQGLLEALSQPAGGVEFGSALAQLAAEDVLRPVEGSRSRLEFKHALLQEAAYGRLVRGRRRALHGRVAEVLAARTAPLWETEPDRIAFHWSRAGQPAKAMAYWELAGRRALKRAAFAEAAEHFRRALDSLQEARPGPEGDLDRGSLMTDIGAAIQAGRTPAADVESTYRKARAAFVRAGRGDRLIPVIRGQWLFYLIRAQYPVALSLGEEMLAMGADGTRSQWLAEGHLYLGLAHMYMGSLERARAELEEAFRLYTPPERPDHIHSAQGDTGVAALAYVALVMFDQGHVKEASERTEESLALADEDGGPVTLAQTWGMHAGLLLTRAKLAELGPWLEKTRTHCAERNIGFWHNVCSLWAAWLFGRTQDPLLGIARLQEELVRYFSDGSRLGVPHFYILLADLRLAVGDKRRALSALAAAEQHMEATGERMSETELHMFRGRAWMAGDDPDPAAAAASFERAVEVATRHNAKLLELRALTYLLAHQRDTGTEPTAIPCLESVCEWFGPDVSTPELARARAVLGQRATLT